MGCLPMISKGTSCEVRNYLQIMDKRYAANEGIEFGTVNKMLDVVE